MNKIIWALGLTIVSSIPFNPAFSQSSDEPTQPTDVAYKDVIITEILADPSPSVGLPEAEFVEIFNRSSATVNLGEWTLSDERTSARLPSISLPSEEYAIIVSSQEAAAFEGIRVVPVTSMPSLNNAGDAVVLRSAMGKTIDSVRYASSWYRNASKRNGGWSLELIDPFNPCGEEDNWTEAEAPEGGTPGKQNSVFASKPDATGPNIVAVTAIDVNKRLIEFDEKLLDERVPPGDVLIDQDGKVNALALGEAHSAHRVVLSGTDDEQLVFDVSFRQGRDCDHKRAEEKKTALAVPVHEDRLDVVINEILFNAKPGG